MKLIPITYSFAAILQFTISTSSAQATTMVSANLAQISTQAESAFVIKINSVETNTSGSGAFDLVSGTITESVFGNVATSETKIWKQFRYSASLPFPAMPQYQPGKEYLIFLSGPGPGTGFQSPMALGQGMFTVMRNPNTGAAIVRNAYMNSTLAAGLDLKSVGRDMVERDSRARSMSPAAKTAEIEKKRMQLRGGPATSLEVVKEAAQFFRAEKLRGRNPAVDYRTTATARLLR